MPMCDMWEKHEQGHLIPPYSIVYNVDGEDDRPLTEVRRLVLTQYHRARAAGNTAWIVGMQMACLSSGAFPYEWILTYIPAEHDSENIKESWPKCPGAGTREKTPQSASPVFSREGLHVIIRKG